MKVPRRACQLAGRVPHEKGTIQIMQHRNHTNWLVRAVLVSFAAACVPLITGGLIVAAIALGVDQ